VRLTDQVDQLLQSIAAVIDNAEKIRGRTVRTEQRDELRSKVNEVKLALEASVYPHRLPPAVFDPSDKGLFGRLAAIALLAQDRVPLESVQHMYGSGVYALYYIGVRNAEYAPISKMETPIYVGKGESKAGVGRAVDQGTKITSRLVEHKRSIERGAGLDVIDFECRYLVIAAGWEETAEDELIHHFRPVWTEQTNVVQGFGKHGDDLKTRGNKRSPWDTFHPGRPNAMDPPGITVGDQKSEPQIRSDIAQHFQNNPPVANLQAVIDDYVARLAQPTV